VILDIAVSAAQSAKRAGTTEDDRFVGDSDRRVADALYGLTSLHDDSGDNAAAKEFARQGFVARQIFGIRESRHGDSPTVLGAIPGYDRAAIRVSTIP
jgi:hypothetical protein